MFGTKRPQPVLQTEKEASLQMANDLHLIADSIQTIGNAFAWLMMGAFGAGIAFFLEAIWKRFS
jgi:hypothetical protein